MPNHKHITSIIASHERFPGLPPAVTIEPDEPFTHIGRRFMGEYVRQKVIVRGADDSCTVSYINVPLWEREL